MKKLSILGSTGSIGTNALNVARHLNYPVLALAAHSNVDLLEAQIKEFRPKLAAMWDEKSALELKKRVGIEVLAGKEGLEACAAFPESDFVVSSIAGTKGLSPTLAAIKAGKTVGLANKEALVSGGALVMNLAKEMGVEIIPIDSEHSAIFQCLQGGQKPRRLILTSSGGPFRNAPIETLSSITPEMALNHPTWKMGPKVTIDSSTLMNKGLEVIEAYWLFNVPLSAIEVVIHPQSIIHSFVEFQDGSILAQMGEPSMIVPIQYAMTHPFREEGLLKPFDFTKARSLELYPPKKEVFKCLSLAYRAIESGGSLPCYMNGANEVLVNRFLNKEIGWSDIASKLETLMQRHAIIKPKTVEDIEEIDKTARLDAQCC